jgi:uncharacterized membrane protein
VALVTFDTVVGKKAVTGLDVFRAVLRNKLTMLVRASILGPSLLLGFATAFLDPAVLMPVLGYATWHGDRETVQAQAWPENRKVPLVD